MERILLSHDKLGYQKAVKAINSDLAVYNNVITVISENTDKVTISIKSICDIMADPKGFLFDLIVDTSKMSFNGIPINKKKAIDLVDFPEEYEAIIQACNTAKAYFSKGSHSISNEVEIDKLGLENVIIEDGKALYTDKVLNELEQEFSSYTRNENQNKAVKIVQALDEALSGLVGLGFVPAGRSLEDIPLNELGFKFYDGKRSIDLDQIRRIR